MISLQEFDRQNVWHPFTPLVGAGDPIFISKGEGVYLYTDTGRQIIDAVSSWWVNLHGHSNPHIAKAIGEQAQKLEHVIFAGFTHEPAIQLSKNLLSILPENQSKVFFSDNGSTAVEVALKMAIQFWHNKGVTSKKKIVALKGAYHGDTFGAMAVGERGAFTSPFASYLFEVVYMEFPSEKNADQLLDEFKAILKDDQVGAFIFEPLIQAAAGMRIYPAKILDKLIQTAHNHNVVCIADEVFTGFGRTGKMFASDHLSNKPDIIAISKGITGGSLPLGVTTCSDEIVSAFISNDRQKTFFHGHSYTANPIACAAANASFELLVGGDCQEQIEMISQRHKDFILKIGKHNKVLEARSLGTILAVELKTVEETSYFNEIRKHSYQFFLDRDILLRPLGNVIYVLPPYVITSNELEKIYNTIEEFLPSLA